MRTTQHISVLPYLLKALNLLQQITESPLKTIPIHRQQQIRRRRIFLPLLRNLRKLLYLRCTAMLNLQTKTPEGVCLNSGV